MNKCYIKHFLVFKITQNLKKYYFYFMKKIRIKLMENKRNIREKEKEETCSTLFFIPFDYLENRNNSYFNKMNSNCMVKRLNHKYLNYFFS